MMDLEYESKIKLLVIKEIRSWLPPGLTDGKFAAKNSKYQNFVPKCQIQPTQARHHIFSVSGLS